MIASFEGLLERLVSGRVEFALAGGLAVCLNGYVRTTVDVNILIDCSPENVARLCECLADFGARYGKHLTIADFPNEPGALRVAEDFDLDIFVQLNGKTLAEYTPLIAYYKLKSGAEIPYLNADALIESKANSTRHKDKVDIGALRDMAQARSIDNHSINPV